MSLLRHHTARSAGKAILAGGVGTAVALTGLISTSPPAHADATTTAAEYAFVRLINRDRAIGGLAPLAVHAPLLPAAENWSGNMAATNNLSHDPNIKAEYDAVAKPYNKGGENVGVGDGSQADANDIHTAFMASPVHHANIMGDWQYVAVGVINDAKGSMWVTERFMNAPAKPTAPQVPLSRIAGATDADTGVALSKAAFPAGGSAAAVVLGRNDVFANALAGGPLASVDNGPLLLTDPNTLTPSVLAEIQRVLPKGGPVHILGGTSAVTPGVESALKAAGYTTDRIAGPDRYSTTVAVSKAMGYTGGPAFLASAFSYPDALVAGPAAGVLKAPIFITDKDSLSAPTASALQATPPSSLTVVGGPAVVSDATFATAGATKRIGGADRYETSTLMADAFFPNASQVAFANGVTWQDALVGAPASAKANEPTLLVATPAPAASTINYVMAHAPSQTGVTIYGTPDTLGSAAMIALYGGAA